MPKIRPRQPSSPPPKERVFFTKQELADRYGVTVSLVNKWMREGKIPFLRLSSQLVRFNPSDVDAALERYAVRERGPGQKRQE